jgi:ribosomal protein L32
VRVVRRRKNTKTIKEYNKKMLGVQVCESCEEKELVKIETEEGTYW